ncbi:hypothetical protein HAX54_040484 [Datura stramonium]|uniref:Uncharacterized protein n=1 Tax=Datura stramonium TaxID=4076 RepID=A0ABS8VP92_DATST|nr:hypothetical protein [Datura stramonium]
MHGANASSLGSAIEDRSGFMYHTDDFSEWKEKTKARSPAIAVREKLSEDGTSRVHRSRHRSMVVAFMGSHSSHHDHNDSNEVERCR